MHAVNKKNQYFIKTVYRQLKNYYIIHMRTVTRKVKSISRLNKIYETLMNNDRLWKRKAGITMSCQLNPPMVEVIDERHEITTRYIVVK
jgi:hypothetical protein